MKSAPAPRTRSRILKAAEGLFARKGFAGTSLREVAQAVGIATPSLLYYFRSKEALYEALLERGAKDLERAFMSILDMDVDDRHKVALLVSRYVDRLQTYPDFFKLLTREQLDNPARVRKTMARYVVPLFDRVLGFFRQRSQEGTAPPVDIRFLLHTLGSASYFFIFGPSLTPLLNGDPPRTQQEMAEAFRSFLLETTYKTLFSPQSTGHSGDPPAAAV
ncbi:MAG: TetR/AcrR family transcriptional regulator [Nitrospirae bacterium]|nr:TetR/AcrR family transcriptional regulator [Nitrospirota bacterium]